MAGSPELNLTLFPPAPQFDDSYHFASLREITRLVGATITSAQAMENMYCYLQERYSVSAIALQTRSGASTRFMPFGESAAIMAMTQPQPENSLWNVHICPLQDAAAPPGQITYVCAADAPAPPELLEAATAQIAFRLGQETLLRRAEEAEQKARQRISELAAIYEIGQAINRIELRELLQLITDRTARLMDAQACSLMLVNHEAGVLRVAASRGLPEAALDGEQKIGEGIAGRVAETEQPMLINGSFRDPRLEGIALNAQISSSMLVPMKNQDGSVFGVLSIRRGAPSPDFTDDDLKLFSVFASQAALAITNFRLYDNLANRAQELLKISELSRALISTLNLKELLARVTEDVCAVVGFDRCGLFLRENPSSNAFVLQQATGYPEALGRNPVREGEGAIGAAARTKKIIHFDARNTPLEERDRAYAQRKGFARALGTDSFVAAPILSSRNRCIGVIVADNRERREGITQAQIGLLSAFVNQAGIAIENAQIHEELHEKSRNILRLSHYTDSVLQSSLAGIISTDAGGLIQRFNRAAVQTLDLDNAPFKEATLSDLIARLGLPDNERGDLLEMIQNVQETGEPHNRAKFTMNLRNRDPITLNLMISRLPDHGQERSGIVLIFDDVTREAHLEARVKEMDRLADIGYLAARMAHEVRNALSPIKCAAQIIKQESEETGHSTEWPDIIIAEADGMSRLTSEMLDFARATAPDLRDLDVEAFLHSAIQRMAAFLEAHHVQVVWDIAEGLPELHADPIQIGQVVRNIVMNAAQAMPDGGDLLISADCDPQGRTLTMRFQDYGVGIPPDQLHQIFRPFVTTKTKGTGLGLPIVQKIVRQHGGKINVASVQGEGTCFSIFLLLQSSQEDRIHLQDILPE